MFRGDLQHTGNYHAAGVPKFSSVQWKYKTAGKIISSPALANGVLYVGSTDKNLYALDLHSQILKWKFAAESAITSSPAVKNGVVYFGSYDGFFYAVSAETGQLRWKFQTGGERRYAGKHLHYNQPSGETMPDPWDFYLSSPAVSNGLVYFGSGDGNIYALDAAAGSLKWKFKTGDVVHASPAIADGTVYIGSWDSYFYALDAATGQEKWRFKTADDPEFHNHVGIQASAVVGEGMVYFGCRDANLYALDSKTGAKKWSFSTKGSWENNSPALHEGKVFFGTSIPSFVHAVDAKTGELIFTVETSAPIFSSMAVAGNTLYFGTFDGKLTAVDLKTQKPAWTFQTESSKKNLPALTKPDGSLKYEELFPQNFYDDMVVGVSKLLDLGTILASPVVVDDVVYVGSTDGYLYALK